MLSFHLWYLRCIVETSSTLMYRSTSLCNLRKSLFNGSRLSTKPHWYYLPIFSLTVWLGFIMANGGQGCKACPCKHSRMIISRSLGSERSSIVLATSKNSTPCCFAFCTRSTLTFLISSVVNWSPFAKIGITFVNC